MDLAYVTGQRPADVLVMRRDDIEDDFLLVQHNKTSQKLRIMMRNEDGPLNSLGRLVAMIDNRNSEHPSPYLLISKHGRRLNAPMLRRRWDEARTKACEVGRDCRQYRPSVTYPSVSVQGHHEKSLQAGGRNGQALKTG